MLLPSAGSGVIYVMHCNLCLGFKSIWYFSSSLKLYMFSVVQIRDLQNFLQVMLFFLGYVVSVYIAKVLCNSN